MILTCAYDAGNIPISMQDEVTVNQDRNFVKSHLKGTMQHSPKKDKIRSVLFLSDCGEKQQPKASSTKQTGPVNKCRLFCYYCRNASAVFHPKT